MFGNIHSLNFKVVVLVENYGKFLNFSQKWGGVGKKILDMHKEGGGRKFR